MNSSYIVAASTCSQLHTCTLVAGNYVWNPGCHFFAATGKCACQERHAVITCISYTTEHLYGEKLRYCYVFFYSTEKGQRKISLISPMYL
jgi:hypothetical protein